MIVEVQDLTFDYPTKRALSDVSFGIAADSITAIVGPNGAGKTTLLRCLAGLKRPTTGTVIAFPANQTIRVQYLQMIDPSEQLSANAFTWQQLRRQMPDAVVQALLTPAKPEPDSPWVQRFAIALRKRPGDMGSPLHALTDFSAYSFNRLDFRQAGLRGAKFEDARVQQSDFRGADLSGADPRWADFDNVDLSYAQLSDADLRDFNPMTRSGFMVIHRLRVRQKAIFMGQAGAMTGPASVKLLHAALDRARMDRAMLVGADLRQASLKQATLRDADLRQSDLRGADLTGTDLSGAALDEAKFDCRTKWPDAFVPAAEPDPETDTAFCRQSIIVGK